MLLFFQLPVGKSEVRRDILRYLVTSWSDRYIFSEVDHQLDARAGSLPSYLRREIPVSCVSRKDKMCLALLDGCLAVALLHLVTESTKVAAQTHQKYTSKKMSMKSISGEDSVSCRRRFKHLYFLYLFIVAIISIKDCRTYLLAISR